MEVVPELRREAFEAADREEQLVARGRLDVVVERVVLEHHGQRVSRQPECLADLGAVAEQAADADREVVLGSDVDLEVGGTERRVHGLERPEQVAAQRLAQPLTANRCDDVVPGEIDLAGVDELFQEGRVAADEVHVARAEVAERVDDLLDVGSRRLEHRDVDYGHRDGHPRRPRAEREGVDDEELLVAKALVERQLEELASVLALRRAAHPVVGLAARAGRLVDDDAACRKLPFAAALLDGEALDVRLLVRDRDRRQVGVEAVELHLGAAVLLPDRPVGRHVEACVFEEEPRPPLADPPEHRLDPGPQQLVGVRTRDEGSADAAGRVEEAEDGRLLDRTRRHIRTSAIGRRRLRGGVRQYPMRRSSQTSALRSSTCSLSAISACAVGLVITEPNGCR